MYVPRNARVFIDCIMDNSHSFWAINLGGDDFDIFLQFSTNYGKENLNNHGVYELPPMETSGMPSALKLLINNTDINNRTIIQCFDGNKLHKTTLYLYSKLYHHYLKLQCHALSSHVGFKFAYLIIIIIGAKQLFICLFRIFCISADS